VEVRKTNRDTQIILSRTHPEFLAKLFEIEVPEIAEGIVKIMGVAREPGSRSKIAVSSSEADVDPVGACVGMRGSRVHAIVQELRGEKIDIVPWNPDPARYVYNALAPADCTQVTVDEASESLEVVVPDDQLSLAIGRQGQNVRLAAKLLGWRIDVISETRFANQKVPSYQEFLTLPDMTESIADHLFKKDIKSMEALADADPDILRKDAIPFIEKAKLRLEEQQEQGDPDKKESGADPLPDTEQDEKRDDTGNMSEGAEAPEDNGDSDEREAAANMPDELTT
jgi:N utilization substance protein A